MMIREPLVQATYYYLREAPGDSPTRRQDRHDVFVTDVYRTLQTLSNGLALTMPDRPAIPMWEAEIAAQGPAADGQRGTGGPDQCVGPAGRLCAA